MDHIGLLRHQLSEFHHWNRTKRGRSLCQEKVSVSNAELVQLSRHILRGHTAPGAQSHRHFVSWWRANDHIAGEGKRGHSHCGAPFLAYGARLLAVRFEKEQMQLFHGHHVNIWTFCHCSHIDFNTVGFLFA